MENPFANPFPGMNPYLESRRLWPEVHNNIIHEMHRFSAAHVCHSGTRSSWTSGLALGTTLPGIRRRDTLSLTCPSEAAACMNARLRHIRLKAG